MGYTFLRLAEDTLKQVGEPLSAEEIWEKSSECGFRSQLQTQGKTPWNTIAAQLYIDIKNNEETIFCQVSKRPSKFGIKDFDYNKKSSEIVQNKHIGAEKTADKQNYKEMDLHPLLTTFVFGDTHFHCYAKTIHHERSNHKNKGKNKWLHPDIVGVYFPFEDFEDSTIKIIDCFSESALKLFSFEMKKEIDESNLREYFFQAVSNSSWANEGYLVALKYKNESDLMDEMRRLNNAFGIGFIKLNSEHVEQSEILISAKRKNIIDWDTINRLVSDNADFKDFIDSINEDYQVKKVKSRYDKRYSDEEMKLYIKEHHIK